MIEKLGITLGPWEHKQEECDINYIRIRGTVLGRRYKIANVLGISVPAGYGLEREIEETRANARAIAAVPDMLEALIKVVKLAEKTLQWVWDVHKIDSVTANEHQIYLQSVIEKACGKTWEEIKELIE